MTNGLEEEVKAFFDEFVKAYPKDDVEKYKSLFQQDENLTMFGTAQKWVGWGDYKDAPAKEKEQFDNISMICNWLNVNRKDDIAWIAAEVEVTVTMGDKSFIQPARLTGVLNKINNKWKIVQGHISSKSQ